MAGAGFHLGEITSTCFWQHELRGRDGSGEGPSQARGERQLPARGPRRALPEGNRRSPELES